MFDGPFHQSMSNIGCMIYILRHWSTEAYFRISNSAHGFSYVVLLNFIFIYII